MRRAFMGVAALMALSLTMLPGRIEAQEQPVKYATFQVPGAAPSFIGNIGNLLSKVNESRFFPVIGILPARAAKFQVGTKKYTMEAKQGFVSDGSLVELKTDSGGFLICCDRYDKLTVSQTAGKKEWFTVKIYSAERESEIITERKNKKTTSNVAVNSALDTDVPVK